MRESSFYASPYKDDKLLPYISLQHFLPNSLFAILNFVEMEPKNCKRTVQRFLLLCKVLGTITCVSVTLNDQKSAFSSDLTSVYAKRMRCFLRTLCSSVVLLVLAMVSVSLCGFQVLSFGCRKNI
jgi:hypothetical protein